MAAAPLHVAEQLPDSASGVREAFGQRAPRRVEIVGHHERPIERTAAHLVEYAGWNPLDRIDDAGVRQRIMLGVARIVRIAGLVQRTFDEQVSGFVARRRTADGIAALDDQHLASGAGKDRARRQAA